MLVKIVLKNNAACIVGLAMSGILFQHCTKNFEYLS